MLVSQGAGAVSKLARTLSKDRTVRERESAIYTAALAIRSVPSMSVLYPLCPFGV